MAQRGVRIRELQYRIPLRKHIAEREQAGHNPRAEREAHKLKR